MWQENASPASSTKIDACLWSLVFGLQPGGQYKLYPRSVSTPIDEASISLIFRKIPVMVRCIITGLERGEGFAQLWNFSNFLGKTRPLCMSTQKYSCENAAAPILRFRRGRRRSWEPIASYQCCIIFRTGTYFPIQTTIVKNRPGRLVCWCRMSRMPRRRLFWNLLGTTSVNMAVMD